MAETFRLNLEQHVPVKEETFDLSTSAEDAKISGSCFKNSTEGTDKLQTNNWDNGRAEPATNVTVAHSDTRNCFATPRPVAEHQSSLSSSFLVENLIQSSSERSSRQDVPEIPSISSWFGNISKDQSRNIPQQKSYLHTSLPWTSPEYTYTMNAHSEPLSQALVNHHPEESLTFTPYSQQQSSYNSDWLLEHSGTHQYQDAMHTASTSLEETPKAGEDLWNMFSHIADPIPDTDEENKERKCASFNQHSMESNLANRQKTDKEDKVKPVNQSIVKREYKRYPKPPYSYAAMTIMAIENSTKKALQYREIKEALREMFPSFFNGDYQGWERSVRHTLSRMNCFVKERVYDGKRNTFQWRVDLSKVEAECFIRQDKKEDLKTTDHVYKLYLHEELDVPPVILPERTCKNDDDETAANVSRAIRNIFVQHQQTKLPHSSQSDAQPATTTDVTSKDKESSTPVISQNQTANGDHDVVLPSKPSTYSLNSLSTFPTDTDDFLGARQSTGGNNCLHLSGAQESTINVIAHKGEEANNSGLPKSLLDSPVQSPIPLDVFRETEGLDRYCPSVESSSSLRSSETTSTSSLPSNIPNLKKRKRENSSNQRTKSAKAQQSQKQFIKDNTRVSSSSVLPSLSTSHEASSATSAYLTKELFNPFPAANSNLLPPLPAEVDKLPPCWPPVEENGVNYGTAELYPFLPFGYPTERIPWQHTGYQLQLPVPYGYQTYMAQYGLETAYGYQNIPNEAPMWYRHPYDDALNLSTKQKYL